jgi:uncharacterized membrane protein
MINSHSTRRPRHGGTATAPSRSRSTTSAARATPVTLLKELDSQRRVGVEEAVVVVRGEDGHLVAKDRIESTLLPATIGGGLIGLPLGIIGGPFGVLIGGATGLMVGSLLDLADMDETDSALGAISSAVQVGRTALLAVVLEQSPKWSVPPCLESPATVAPPAGSRGRGRDRSRGRGRAQSEAGSSQRAAPGTPRARQSSRQGKDR